VPFEHVFLPCGGMDFLEGCFGTPVNIVTQPEKFLPYFIRFFRNALFHKEHALLPL